VADTPRSPSERARAGTANRAMLWTRSV
jgi:hypothetical protein